MNNDKILRAIGNIDEDLISRAAPADHGYPRGRATRLTFAPWFRWTTPVAVCLVIAIAVAALLRRPSSGSVTIPSPSLSLDSGISSSACYPALEDWRGLPTENYVLDGLTDDMVTSRMVYKTLDDLVSYADAFVLVPNVHETEWDGDNMQTSIAEYGETIGDKLTTRQWDDRTVSTGSRVLIRQQLIGGSPMDEPSNFLRQGGVYLLPIKFNPDWGAYEVLGDHDVLFELNDEGKIVSHSKWEDYNKYDGKSLSKLIDDIRALYPATNAEFAEQPIITVEQAKEQVITAYNASGFRKFSAEYDSETVVDGADVYLFKISFDYGVSEYAAIAKENGAFIRGELKPDGDIQVWGGLGGFP